jgi:hypothetical protein
MKKMKNEFNLFRIAILFIAISCIAGDCDEKKGIKSLNSVEIPEYTDDDYVKQLDNQNPEIVYNAICNLIDVAGSYALTLSNDSIKDSVQINKAKLVYDRMSGFLKSGNDWIVCASLRFFSEFSPEYKNKQDIIKNLIDVNLKSKSIRLEYINAVKALTETDLQPFYNIFDDYLNNKSWLISRYTYQIIARTNNTKFNNYLIDKYKGSEEYDKLLIISTIPYKYNDTILDFITAQLKTEKNKKIKLYLSKFLSNAKNTNKVTAWLNSNFNELNDIKGPMAEYYINQSEHSFNPKIVRILLAKKMVEDSLIPGKNNTFFHLLYTGISDKKTASNTDFNDLETELMRNEGFKNKWIAYKLKQEKKNLSDEFIAKQLKLISEFKQKSSGLYDAYKIDDEYKKEFTDQISNLEKAFIKK